MYNEQWEGIHRGIWTAGMKIPTDFKDLETILKSYLHIIGNNKNFHWSSNSGFLSESVVLIPNPSFKSTCLRIRSLFPGNSPPPVTLFPTWNQHWSSMLNETFCCHVTGKKQMHPKQNNKPVLTNLEEELVPMSPVSQRTPMPLGYRACASISFTLKSFLFL